MIKIWETVEENLRLNHNIFDTFSVIRKNPKNSSISDFTLIKSLDWVNIIPITKKNKIVMIEQYRHGIDNITLEIPGGMIEKNEDPALAGQRECKEETGYHSNEETILLGITQPNPAFMNNVMYHYLWKNCELKYEQNFDEFEDINVVLYSINEVEEMILNGKLKHSLVIAAFYYQKLRNL